jgi:hypothetical protein
MMTTSGNITPPSRPGAILQSLIGSWAIERRVDDMATLTGSVNFERSAENEAVYHETGTLRLSTGYEAAAERKYIYRQCGDGLAVFFDERPPRLFHMVKLIRDGDGYLTGEAEHICADDVYLTDYKFDSDTQFRVRHRVRGPRKDYTIITLYRKIVDPD